MCRSIILQKLQGKLCAVCAPHLWWQFSFKDILQVIFNKVRSVAPAIDTVGLLTDENVNDLLKQMRSSHLDYLALSQPFSSLDKIMCSMFAVRLI